MSRILNVWWEERLAGQLSQDRHGQMLFAYAQEWLDAGDAALPLSVSLPKRVEPYSGRECGPFFGGLLPDEDQREVVARVLGVSGANDFALLERLGGDVAGALQLLPLGAAPSVPDPHAQPLPLSPEDLVALLDELPVRPFLAGEEGLRLSLAGAQVKLPVIVINGGLALPAAGQATTHIIKSPIPHLPDTVENEAFVMRLAGRIGLQAARVTPRMVSGRKFLLIERYDRASGSNGRVRRIHQEDFCQALGIRPERKYAAEGGPTLQNAFALLRAIAARPAVELLKMLDAVIFNLIAGNADAHGKNFSLLYADDGPRLAPLYDLLSTTAYPALSPRLAMKIGKRATLEEMDARGWKAFAGDARLGLPLVRRRVGEISVEVADRALEVAAALQEEGLDKTTLSELAHSLTSRARRCARNIDRRSPRRRAAGA